MSRSTSSSKPLPAPALKRRAGAKRAAAPTTSESARLYHHGNLRQALLDAALQLLKTTPPNRLSLRELARAAEVSHAAPYHYFSDREELIKAAGVESMRRFLQAQQQAVAAQEQPLQKLVALGLAYIGFAAREPHAFALIFDPQLCPPGQPSDDMAPLIHANEALLGQCVQASQSDRTLRGQDPEAMAHAMWGAVHGLAHLVMAGHLPLEAARPAVRALVDDL